MEEMVQGEVYAAEDAKLGRKMALKVLPPEAASNVERGVFLMGATGEAVKRLTDFGYDPAWSPDGQHVAFATQETVTSWRRSGSGQTWVVDVGSGQSRLLTKQVAIQPSWSPDGHRIAFCGFGKGGLDIYTIPALGGETIPVTEGVGNDVNPTWSPDGEHLYFSSNRGGSMNLWRVRVDEASGNVLGEPEPITSGGAAERHSMSFSKDGLRVAYVEDVTSTNLEKVAFDPKGGDVKGQPIPITRGPSEKYLPDVSPDGIWLVYSREFPHTDVAVVRQDGTEYRQLTNDPHTDLYPRWSPDGRLFIRLGRCRGTGGSHPGREICAKAGSIHASLLSFLTLRPERSRYR